VPFRCLSAAASLSALRYVKDLKRYCPAFCTSSRYFAYVGVRNPHTLSHAHTYTQTSTSPESERRVASTPFLLASCRRRELKARGRRTPHRHLRAHTNGAAPLPCTRVGSVTCAQDAKQANKHTHTHTKKKKKQNHCCFAWSTAKNSTASARLHVSTANIFAERGTEVCGQGRQRPSRASPRVVGNCIRGCRPHLLPSESLRCPVLRTHRSQRRMPATLRRLSQAICTPRVLQPQSLQRTCLRHHRCRRHPAMLQDYPHSATRATLAARTITPP
jgi:hypothetical protein